MAAKLWMIEVEETQGVLPFEHLSALAVERNQRRGRVENPAKVATDTCPATMNSSVEAFAGEDLVAAKTVAGFDNDPLVIPRCGQHRAETGLRKLEVCQFTFETDSRQRLQQGQRARKSGGRKKNQPGISGRQGDADLDLTADQVGRGIAGFLERKLQFERRTQIGAGEMAEIDPFGGREAGCDEGVTGVCPPHGAGAEALHGAPNIEPLEKGCRGVGTGRFVLSTESARTRRERLVRRVGDPNPTSG